MASLFYRLTYSALTASLLFTPAVSHAQDAIATHPQDATPSTLPPPAVIPSSSLPPIGGGAPRAQAQSQAPVQAQPDASAAPRPLDDDRYTPPSATSGAVGAAPINRPPPGAVVAPPPPAPAAVQAAPYQAPVAAAPPRRARPTPKPAPPPPPEVKLSVQGKVVASADKTHPIKVGQGDTVNVIADRLKVSKEALIKANKLKKPYALDVGQVLQIPTPKSYVIQTGDNLNGISHRFGTPPEVLGEINDFDIADRLKAGQKIALPADAHDSGPIKIEVPGTASRASESESAPTPPTRAASKAADADTSSDSDARLTIQGKVEADSKKSRPMRVGAGDTVNVIADRLLTEPDDLIKLNKLKKPYELDRGQVLKIPTPQDYVVLKGDTLAGIGHRFGIAPEALAEINDLDLEPRLKSGQRIALPADVHDSGPVKAAAAPPSRPFNRYEPVHGETEPPPVSNGGRVLPPTRSSPPSYSGPPVVDAAPSVSDAQIIAAGHGRFNWPLSGQVLSGFGPKPGGQRNDGLDLAAPLGTPVLASAEGDVVYAGNQVPGFGTLVLVKHPDGWVTAYTHLGKAEKKIKDHVLQGEEIGQVGQTGGADQPELHFEIRYAASPKDRALPIDPTLVLPTR